jgi:arylsulfatase A-like enzyme
MNSKYSCWYESQGCFVRCKSLMNANLALFLFVLLAHVTALRSAEAPRPNIIFILADDMGWGDLNCYGNPRIHTPNLDRLAKMGTLFEQFYVCGSVCSPSRAAFMTGRFPARVSVHSAIGVPEANKAKAITDWLDPKLPTVTSLLKQASYATSHFGKWHLGIGAKAPKPDAYGIDDHRTWHGVPGTPDWKMDPADFWPKSNELIADETIRFIRANKDRPFFVNAWPLIPHAPLNPTEEQMKTYKHLDWGRGIPHHNAQTLYFASITDLDTQVGRIMREVDKLGIRDKTMILFSSDNGPEVISSTAAGHAAAGSAGPFRGRKRSLYEGGVRVPFIACWPGKIPAGRIDKTSILCGADLLPTACKLAGISIPADLDGEDISDILRGKERPRAKPLMWEWRFSIGGAEPFHQSPTLAIRDGDWKLLINADKTRAELFNIPADPTELLDQAALHPEVVEKLSTQVLAWKKTLPPGPYDIDAGQRSWFWPGDKRPTKADRALRTSD